MTESPANESNRGQWAAIVFALALPSLVTLAYFVWAEQFAGMVQQVVYSLAKVVQFGFPVVWVCWVLKERPRWQQPITRGLFVGVLFGLVVAGAMMALYFAWLQSADFFQQAATEIRGKINDLQVDARWKFALLGVFYSLIHSLLEEYYWRWFVFGQLKKVVPLGSAVVISSLGFMAHHVIVLADFFGSTSPVTWLFSLSIAVGGAFWAWLYHRSGSLLGPWMGHLLVDAAIFAIGYQIAF